MMSRRYTLLITTLTSIICLHSQIVAFSPVRRKRWGSNTALFGNGKGEAKTYSWIENRREVEVTVKVPKGTRAKDILFKTSPYSIDLKLAGRNGKHDIVLLNGDRQLRGKIRMDGTYWAIEDAEDNNSDDYTGPVSYREIKVCIEKHRFLADVECDDDWGGVFLDDKKEVISRDYAQDEELDIDEYTKKLGVDLEQLTVNDIDQSMFSSTNMTQGLFEKLLDSGFAREVINEKNRVETYSSKTEKSEDELDVEESFANAYFDVDPVEDPETQFDDEEQTPFVEAELVDNSTGGHLKENTLDSLEGTFREYLGGKPLEEGQDPVDALTIAQLKEMCRDYNLKVTGNKEELRTRMKEHIMNLISANFDMFRSTDG